MGAGVTYQDLIDQLEPVGLPIVAPGATAKALPCITIEPLGMSLQPGVQVCFDRCYIKVRYSMSQGDEHQFEQCRLATASAIGALKGTQVALEPDVDILGESDVANPVFYFQISAAFPGVSLCPEPTPNE